MDFDDGFIIGFALSCIGMGFAAYFAIIPIAKNEVHEEAFQRGYMVECVGVEGYYWECEE